MTLAALLSLLEMLLRLLQPTMLMTVGPLDLLKIWQHSKVKRLHLQHQSDPSLLQQSSQLP